jgi:hypothetical protein
MKEHIMTNPADFYKPGSYHLLPWAENTVYNLRVYHGAALHGVTDIKILHRYYNEYIGSEDENADKDANARDREISTLLGN